MADTTLQTLKGIYGRLSGFAGLTSLVSTRIYSDVPQQASFPYVKISIPNSEDFSTKNASDYNHKVRVQVFSRQASPKEAIDVREQVFLALDRQEENITVTGATVVRIQKDQLSTLLEDVEGWQAVIQFDCTVQSN